MASRTGELSLPVDRDAGFTACVQAAERLGWSPLADAGEGGVDIVVPSSRQEGRPKATLRARLHDGDGETRIRLTCEFPTRRPAAGNQAQEIVDAYKDVLQGGKPRDLTAGLWSPEKLSIRILTVVLFAGSIAVALAVALPPTSTQGSAGAKTNGDQPAQGAAGSNQKTSQAEAGLPAVALGQEAIYRLEIGLLVFYGGLVVLTPVFYGAVRGRIPSEVSARGAKFTEDAAENLEQSLEEAKGNVDQLDERLKATEDNVDIVSLGADALRNEFREELDSASAQLDRARRNIDEIAAASNVSLSD